MARLERTIACLAGFDDQAIDQAIGAALPTAGPDATPLLGALLLNRARAEGYLGLILNLHLLPPPLPEQLVERVHDLDGPLREAVTRRDSQGPRNALEIIRRSRAVRLAYLLTELLVHGDASLQREAASCLLDLARWCCTDRIPGLAPACEASAARFVQRAVEQAVSTYDRHRQPDVLRAVGELAPRPLPEALRHLVQPRRMAGEALRVLLQQVEDPGLCRVLPVLLAQSSLTGAIAPALAKAVGGPMLVWVLGAAHLARHGPVAAALRQASRVAAALPAPPALVRASAHRARTLPGWLAGLPLTPAAEIGYLAELAQHAAPLARLAALGRLIAVAGDDCHAPANTAVARFCADREPALARIAMRHLIRVQWSELARLLPALVNHSDASVRQLAATHLARVGFDRLWGAWPHLGPDQRLSAGQALLKVDREFHRQLARRLSQPDPEVRVRAISIVRELNQGPPFEAPLIALASSADAVVASAAVRVLGTVNTEPAMRALDQALHHPDERVRANAIEALQQLRATHQVDQIARMADEDANRPRANAIRSLLEMRFADALAALTAMLRDPRGEHRTSALWLVEAAGLLELSSQVAEMSISDPQETVRARAHAVVQSLMAMMRQPTGTGAVPQPVRA